jgi:Rrf2 family protein
MGIPKRVEYSILVLAALAEVEPAKVNARALADQQHLPPGYVQDVLAALRRAKLVRAVRGTHGGYALSRPPEHITLGRVVRVLDGTHADGEADPALPDDSEVAVRLHDVWDRAHEARMRLLDAVTLADIVRTGRTTDDRLAISRNQ